MGRGILLGGVPGVAPAHITILGGGVVGANAARIAAGFQADVAILDVNLDRLRYLDDVMPPNVNALFSDRHTIREELKLADLVIGSILIPGAKAPHLVRREDLRLMKPGSVIIDVAIDQGVLKPAARLPTNNPPIWWMMSFTIVLPTCRELLDERVPLRCATSLCHGSVCWRIKEPLGRFRIPSRYEILSTFMLAR
jgi:alanine dehydrogenase